MELQYYHEITFLSRLSTSQKQVPMISDCGLLYNLTNVICTIQIAREIKNEAWCAYTAGQQESRKCIFNFNAL